MSFCAAYNRVASFQSISKTRIHVCATSGAVFSTHCMQSGLVEGRSLAVTTISSAQKRGRSAATGYGEVEGRRQGRRVLGTWPRMLGVASVAAMTKPTSPSSWW